MSAPATTPADLAVRRRPATAADVDPSPPATSVPLTSEEVEAAAACVAVCIPEAARTLHAGDITDLTLAAIVEAAQRLHARCESINVSSVLAEIAGKVETAHVLREWLHYDIGNPRRANPEAVAEAVTLAAWRRLREHFLRAAIGCEVMDLRAVVDSLEAATRITARARTNIARAA